MKKIKFIKVSTVALATILASTALSTEEKAVYKGAEAEFQDIPDYWTEVLSDFFSLDENLSVDRVLCYASSAGGEK